MKSMQKGLFAIALLVSSSAFAADTVGRSYFMGHVGSTAGSGLVQEAGRAHKHDEDGMYGCFSTHTEYNQNFDRKKIGNYLFFNGTNVMTVGGKRVAGTATSAIDIQNTYFLLGNTFASTLTALPKVTTISSDLRLNVGLDEFMEGLYFSANLPIVYTKWDVGLVESSITANGAGADIGTGFLEAGATATPPYANMIAAFKGDKTVGDVTTAMAYGKIDGSQKETKIGNVNVNLGYNFINKENCHLGAQVTGMFNGNGKSKAVYLFEPTVGTGGRHGIGGGIDGHFRLYEHDNGELNAYLKANALHLFDATVKRTYDFTTQHGKGSRYLLLKELTAAGAYNDVMTYASNISTLQAKIGIDVMYDVNLMFRYTHGSLALDLGYSLWGHSKEKHKEWVDSFTSTVYGAMVTTTADADGAVEDLISANVSISGAQAGGTTAATVTADAAASLAAKLVVGDLDKNSGMMPSAMSHHVFGNIGYTWEDSEWMPHVGAGAGAEFSGNDNNAFDQWGVHFTGGICF